MIKKQWARKLPKRIKFDILIHTVSYLKRELVSHSLPIMTHSSSSQPFNPLLSEKEIKNWLDGFGVHNYTINSDLSVNVEGSVNFSGLGLEHIEVRFSAVTGDFNIDENSLTSLVNSPFVVGGIFSCTRNQLTSLEGAPRYAQTVACSHNLLRNLEHCPLMNLSLYCENNLLESLSGLKNLAEGPVELSIFNCSGNRLTSLEGGPLSTKHHYFAQNNQLTTLDFLPKRVEGRIYLDENAQLGELQTIHHLQELKFSWEKKCLERLIEPKNEQHSVDNYKI